ncbi:MAG: sulfoxide reductase heme-binding subunit YedZ [Bryobacteraceae bacterium]|nr:sulfoxide reductase heme-binding subunit YedZ [Bryobacteraceae bacterium]
MEIRWRRFTPVSICARITNCVIRIYKALVWLACLFPLAMLLYKFRANDLTANPIEYITHETGDWGLRILLVSLMITPLRRLGFPTLIQYRRLLGLFAFFYICLHFAIWFLLDRGLDLGEMWSDVMKRRFITAGMLGLALMVPLAITSTKGWIRRLGKRWQLLHRAVYVSAVAGVVHYYWLVKSDIRLPALYGGVLLVLFGARLWHRLK